MLHALHGRADDAELPERAYDAERYDSGQLQR